MTQGLTKAIILNTPTGDLDGLAKAIEAALGSVCDITSVSESTTFLAKLKEERSYDFAALDYFLGDGTRSGEEVLRDVRGLDAEIPVIAVAEKGDVDIAQKAISAGATDFLVRGPRLEERVSTQLGKIRKFVKLIRRNRALGQQYERMEDAERARFRIVGKSPQVVELIKAIERVATVPRPALIVGERGSGKELVARAIHASSGHHGRPFITVNCSAIADTLLESELFGHERGAFTGAERRASGKFEQADGGTLFLDEIGNMSLPFQQKILRVAEYGAFSRIGGTIEITVNVRIISATNADLEEKMRRGEFLRDLYDRLAFEVIRVPPLREREGDVAVLAEHFLNEFMVEAPAFRGKIISKKAIETLSMYSFPGNVRELKNIIERAVYRDTSDTLEPEDFGLNHLQSGELPAGSFREKIAALERKLIAEALKKTGGKQAEAARLLGMSYHQFRHYYKKYRPSIA